MENTSTVQQLYQEAKTLAPRMESVYRILHQNPELGRHEWESAVLIERSLAALGLEVSRAAETGVVALLRGRDGGRTVALRAELDALPITEETKLPWASQRAGVMHACGHDFHCAALLGAARLLGAHREELAGNVKCFFQPDEEGDGGAERMIGAGCMERPEVDAVFALHCDSALPVGQAAAVPGRICAASDPFTITLRGRGSHGAKPQEGDDVIVAAAQIITALQTIVSRRTAPTEPAVITVGALHSGSAGNVLPTEARLKGIIRTLDPALRQKVRREVADLVQSMAAAMGVRAEVDIRPSYPGVCNDEACARTVQQAAAQLLGAENVLTDRPPSMGADDFGYFSAAAPGCYWQIGTSDPTWETRWPNHTPEFRVSERALPVAAALHAAVAMSYLRGEPG